MVASDDLTDEAVRKAQSIEFEGTAGRVFSGEHLIAVAARVGWTRLVAVRSFATREFVEGGVEVYIRR